MKLFVLLFLCLVVVPAFLTAGVITHEFQFSSHDLSFSSYEGYDVVQLRDGVSNLEVGHPLIPFIVANFVLPPGSEVTSVRVVSKDEVEVGGVYDLCPVQTPRPFSYEGEVPFVGPDPLVYSSPSLYPGEDIEWFPTGSMSGYRIAGIFLYPLQYLPSERRLLLSSSMVVELEYEEGVHEILALTPKQVEVFSRSVGAIVENVGDVGRFSPPEKANPSRACDYAIITNSSHSATWQRLANWKNSGGYTAQVFTTSWIYSNYTGSDNQERIRNFLKDYFTTEGLIYAVLAGDVAIVPERDAYSDYYSPYYLASDYYYSDLDGDWDGDGDGRYGERTGDGIDGYFDIYVGRPPVDDVADINAFLQKDSVYIYDPPVDYIETVLLPGVQLFSGYHGRIVNDAIGDMFPGWTVTKLEDQYSPATRNAWNQNYNFCHIAAHGSYQGFWGMYSQPVFTTSDIPNLTNVMPTILTSIACHPGDFDEYGDCFAEQIMNKTGGSGTVACALNSRYGFGSPPVMGPSERMDTCFFAVMLKETLSIGILHGASKNHFRNLIWQQGVWHYCGLELNLFGDPEMEALIEPTNVPRCRYHDHSIDDNTGGNGDGVISSFETIYMPVLVLNDGGVVAKEVVANIRLHSGNSFITLIDTVADFGDILPDSIAQGSPDYSFSVANGIANGDTVWFELEMMDSGGGDWFGYFSEVVWNPELSYEGLLIDDAGEWRPNGILNPGETVDMILSVMNSNGYAHATGLSGVLRISDTYVSVVDSTAAFPDISPGGTVDNSSSPFEVYADNGLPYDHQVDCELILTGDNVVDTMYFSFIAGERTEDDPTGPDDYAYWAYDMYDTLYTECPTYGWEEVDPNYGGSGTDLVLGDNETKQLALPFSFKYYGTDYDTISVCSNGWLALGVTSDTDFRYYAPPDVMGPPAAVGVFWGSLDPSAAGGVYYYYDSGLHAFIVEWSRVDHENTAGEETFQVLLSDPAYNPTVTGDGEIFCQYLYVTYPDNSMTAIEDETETLGLLYQISDSPDPGAAPLADAFVCKFTTDPPQYVVGMSESDKPAMPKVYGLSQSYPNPCGSHAVINYQLPRKSGVSLRVYDVSGRLVDELVSGAIDAGYHSVRLDTKSYMSGVYFYRLVAGNRVFMKKMIVVK